MAETARERYVLRDEVFGGTLFDRKSFGHKFIGHQEIQDGIIFNGVSVPNYEKWGASLVTVPVDIPYSPIRIYFELTRKCNLACSTCFNSSGLEGRRLIGCAEYEEKFLKAVNDDLDIPGAVSVVWDLVKSDYPLSAKKASLFKFDEVLGLGLENFSSAISEIPFEVEKLVDERSKAREAGDFQKSDDLRRQIKDKGWIAEDTAKGTAVKKKL